MPKGDVSAVRPGAAIEDGPGAGSPLGPPPAPPMLPPSPARRPLRGAAAAAFTLGLHAVFALLFVLAWRSMVRDVQAPEIQTWQLVSSVPGEPPKTAPAEEPRPPPPKPPAAEPPAPKPQPAETAATPPAPSSAQTAMDEALRGPSLLEPPPEPKAAASQNETNQRGNTATTAAPETKPSAGAPEAPPKPADPVPPAAPPVLSSTEGTEMVPAPAPKPPEPQPPASGDPAATAKNATATLNAALATASLPMPASFRAALSAQGRSDSADYRGSVFGALSRAQQAVNDDARARHLQGQVVLAIVLTDTGAIGSLKVLQSSGHADADAFAIDMVRRSAPFPPPPPGASHSFTPAISFGNAS